MKYLHWALLWPLTIVMFVIGRLLSPFACMFIVRKPRFDTVKRLGRINVTLPRDSLVWWLTWFDTDDNATDEYWYGLYDKESTKTQEYYDTHRIYRWWMRVMWLNRNNLYTFNRKFLGINKDSWRAWSYKKNIPLWFGYYNSVNIGYKAHKGFDKLLYAGRLIGIKKQG